MKARELIKKPLFIEDIEKEIKQANDRGDFKYFIPHYVCVEESVTFTLIKNGFKVYTGCWFANGENGLIIEW